jgi:hypothetical protein
MNRYRLNPFRILDVAATASEQEYRRQQKRLIQSLALGVAQHANGLLPLAAEPLDAGAVDAAAHELEDPLRRLRFEVFWLACERTARLLRAGRYEAFLSACRSAAGQAGPEAALARHDLAVFLHAVAVASGGKACPPEALRLGDWRRAFEAWEATRQDEDYWRYVERRALAIGDGRLRGEDVQALRTNLCADLLRANEALFISSGGDQLALTWSSPFPLPARASACEKMIGVLRAPFADSRREIADKLRGPELAAVAPADAHGGRDAAGARALCCYLDGVAASIQSRLVPAADRVNVPGLRGLHASVEILDDTAGALRALSLAYNNEADDPHRGQRYNAQALRYAAADSLRTRLAEDAGTLLFLGFRKDALQAADEGRWAECIRHLDQALAAAETPEARENIQRWRASAVSRARGYPPPPVGGAAGSGPQRERAVKRAPRLGTVNGIGTRLYGHRDPDPRCGTFVATLWLTVFWLPIYPIAAYRVAPSGARGFRFLARVPVSSVAVAARVCFFVALFALSSLVAASPGGAGNPPVSAAGRAAPSAAAPRDTAKRALGRRLGWEHAAISLEKSLLASERARIDLDRTMLPAEPAQGELDRFNAEVNAFNAKLHSLRRRIARYNREVAEYNSMP